MHACSEEPRPGSHVHVTEVCTTIWTALELTYTTQGREPNDGKETNCHDNTP